MKQTLGKVFKSQKDESQEGVLSSLEAISTAIGGSVGFGNIAGVATSVQLFYEDAKGDNDEEYIL